MPGLIKKDFILVKKQIFVSIALMLIYAVTMGFDRSEDFTVGTFGGYVIAYMAIIPLILLAYDEKYKWGQYSAAMPISRKENVLSKYIVLIAFLVIVTAVYSVFALLYGISGFAVKIVGVASMALIMGSVMLALGYKFGTQAAKIICFAVLFIFVLCITLAVPHMTDINININETAVALTGAAAGIIVYVICIFASFHFYQKKDL